MCNIVLIDAGTLKEGYNLEDYMAVHEDDVELGPAYDTFKILKMPGIKAEDVKKALEGSMPSVKKAFKTSTPANEWGFDYPEEKDLWDDAGTWKAIEKRPVRPYRIDTKKFSSSITADTKKTKEERLAELQKGIVCNLKEMAENQTVVSVHQQVVKDTK